jgi:hypothetical protein
MEKQQSPKISLILFLKKKVTGRVATTRRQLLAVEVVNQAPDEWTYLETLGLCSSH